MPKNDPIENLDTSNEFSHTSRETLTVEINDGDFALITNAKLRLEALSLDANDNEKAEIRKQLDKIESLKKVIIPTNDGDKIYYSMADSAGGVTEKTCLIDEDTLKRNLQSLVNATNFADIEKNKIRMNAILKHPKAGKDTEVQREAIGLKIARMLGFEEVTESTLVNHDTGNGRHPCLFVPFGQMDLLTDSMDDTASARGRLKKNHFQSVEDLGKYSAFFMLCGDPDFIGKDGQNKGLTRAVPEKKLYIFDQVFMTNNNLGLDRSFNLVPTNILSYLPNFIARHFMGRNKSVINDSKFEEKIQSAIELLQRKEDIQQMFKDVMLANSNMPDDPLVKTLQKDAKESLKSFNARIGSIEKLFPPIKVNGESKQIGDLVKASKNDDISISVAANKNLELLKKSMLVTQLINKPQLFDKSGKPYRAPFFTNPSTSVKGVSIDELSGEVTISFSRRFGPPLSENKQATLREYGFTISEDGKSATISQERLKQLNEQSYFKEQENSFDLNHKYIDSKKIEALGQTYKEDENNVARVKRLDYYLTKSKNPSITIQLVLNELDKIPFKNKGFAAHIQQCILYDAMKVIIEKNPDRKMELENAFERAKQDGSLKEFVTKELKAIAPQIYLDNDYLKSLKDYAHRNKKDNISELLAFDSKAENKTAELQSILEHWKPSIFKNERLAAYAEKCFLSEAMKVIILQNPESKQDLEKEFHKANQEGRLKSCIIEKLGPKHDVDSQRELYSRFRSSSAAMREGDALSREASHSDNEVQTPRSSSRSLGQ